MPVDGKWLIRAVVLTAAVLVGLYAWSVDNPIMASDSRVLNDYHMGSPGLAAKLFVSAPESGVGLQERYSPVASFSLAVNRSIWGDDPAGYRIVALLLHGLSSLFIFLILARFGIGKLWALLASLVFAVHPVHTQTINMIASKGHILSGMFALAAIYVFVGAMLRSLKGAGLRRSAGSWGALALFFVALLCGWEALVFLFVCLLLPYALGVAYPHWRFYVGLGVAVSLYTAMALIAGGPAALFLSQGYWAATAFFKSMGLILVIPADQMIFHPLDYVFSWAEGRALAAIGLAVAFAIACVLLRNRRRGLSLSLGLIACASPAYFFAAGREGALMEPGLYVLAAAVCVLIGAVAELLAQMRGARPVVVVVMALLLGAAFVTAAARNSVWSDPERVWNEVLKAYPNSGVAKEELSEYYRNTGRADKAAEVATAETGGELSGAVRLNNEGVAKRDMGRLTEAAASFREAIEIWPDFRDAHFNLGVVYHNLRMNDSAVVSLRRAAAIDPMYPESRYNLGIVYDELGDSEMAEVEYRQALNIDENHAKAWANLGSLLGKRGDFQGAIVSLERALSIEPGLLQARFNLALAYEKVDVEKAKEEWRSYLDLARRRGVDPGRLSQMEKRLEEL